MLIDSVIWGQIEKLCNRGAQFVPVGSNKQALCKWKTPLSFSTLKAYVQAHECEIAIVPGSLNLAVVDVDKGDPGKIKKQTRPICTSRTPRGGEHLYYDATDETGYQFQGGDVEGDVLINNLAVLRHSSVLFHLNRHTAKTNRKTRLPELPKRKSTNDMRCHTVQPEDAQIGERNITLFNTLRFWGYRNIPTGAEFEDVKHATRREARHINFKFPTPLENREVNATADSITRFCIDPNRNTFNGLIAYLSHLDNTDPDRSKAVRQRAAESTNQKRWGSLDERKERDEKIRHDLNKGMSKTEASRKYNLSRRQIIRISQAEVEKGAEAHKQKIKTGTDQMISDVTPSNDKRLITRKRRKSTQAGDQKRDRPNDKRLYTSRERGKCFRL